MGFNFRAAAEAMTPEPVEMPETSGLDQPPACSYCGGVEFEGAEDHGRGLRAKCAACGGTMTSDGMGYWQPELIGSPKNHPKPNPDPASGGVPGVWAPVLRREDLSDQRTAAVDWCRHRHAEHCWLPKNDTAGAMALYVPQDRGACPWTTASMQQINCPVSEPGPMAGMTRAGAAETPPPARGMGPNHDQASCPVCTQTEPGRVVHTAAPIPAPHENPMEGGHSWYHGTNYDPEEDYKYQSQHRQFTHPQQTLSPDQPGYQTGPRDVKREFTGDPGGRLTPPNRGWTGKFGGNAHYHWNTDLGVHYSSHKETADEFAHSGISKYDDSVTHVRTAHTHLHMQNPIHFQNEKELGAHAVNWARENGHKFLPEHPEAHEHFIKGEDREVSKYSPHVEYNELTQNHIPMHDENRRAHFSRFDKEGIQNPRVESLDHIDGYLANHPDREDMMGKYRDHLKSKGHDGIVYGNSYEGPFEHPCAIAFPDTVQHIHKWEWHHPQMEHKNQKIEQPEYDPGQHALFPHGTSPMDWERSPHFKAGAHEFGHATHLSWDEIGERHPHIYGDADIHGDAADGADGPGIGDAANYLAHERPDDPDVEGHSVHDLDFHEAHVDPKHIDYAPSEHSRSESRMQKAYEGFKAGQGHQIPPVVLVHRHGVYQVADGHHRAEGAHKAGTTLRAYVAHSPYPDEPDRDGEKGPYNGRAVPVDAPDPHRKESSVDPELRMHMTATWADVRNKAKRIRAEGGVNLLAASFDGLAGNVQGDTAIYETSLNYLPGTYKVAYWTCGCAWASYAWGRSAPYRRFEGRMCSHALAMQFEAQSRGMFGKTVEPDSDRPSWLRAHSPVQTHYDRDSGTGRTRRAVPPGNMRTRFEGARALDPDGIFPTDHGLLLDRPPVYAFAVVALSQGEAPSKVAAGLEGAGLDRAASLALLGAAMEDPLSAVAALPGPKQTTRCPDCGQEVSSTAQKCPHCGADLSTADPADVHVAAKKPEDDGPTHAGLVLKAGDTGRILMLQRSLEDEKDPARGTWEFPGGGIEAGDHSSFHGAMREFAEEVGQPVPAGGTLQHVWRSGPYQGHVLVIPSENQIKLADGRIVPNPDDPKGDHPEQAAWYDPEHAQKHPALRPECKSAPWKTIKAASRGKAATFATGDPLGDFAQDPPAQRPDPKPGDQENPGSTGFATAADPPAFDAADSRTMRMPEMSSWGVLNRLWAQAANYRQGPHRANDDLHDPESGAHFPAGSEVHVRGHYTDEDGTTWAEVKHRGRDSAFVPADQLTHRDDFSTPETGPKGDPAVHQKIRDDHAREQHHERFLDKTIGPVYHPNEFGGHGRAPWGGMPHTHDTSVPSGETSHEQPRYPHADPADSGNWVDHFDPQNPSHHIDHLYGAPKTHDGLPIQSLNSLNSGRMSIGDAARAYLRTGELHDPEQGALPATTAEDEDGWTTDVDPAHQHVDVADTLARPDPREEMRSSIDPTEEGAMQPNQVHASTGSVDDIVARFQASAAGRALASDQGSPAAAGPTDAQIAQAARAHVAKTALKDFSPAEQRELIEEGRGGERARNFGDLKIEGTHYEALGKALDHHEQITDVDALFI